MGFNVSFIHIFSSTNLLPPHRITISPLGSRLIWLHVASPPWLNFPPPSLYQTLRHPEWGFSHHEWWVAGNRTILGVQSTTGLLPQPSTIRESKIRRQIGIIIVKLYFPSSVIDRHSGPWKIRFTLAMRIAVIEIDATPHALCFLEPNLCHYFQLSSSFFTEPTCASLIFDCTIVEPGPDRGKAPPARVGSPIDPVCVDLTWTRLLVRASLDPETIASAALAAPSPVSNLYYLPRCGSIKFGQ